MNRPEQRGDREQARQQRVRPGARRQRDQRVGRQVDAAGALQRERERQHADDQHQALPVDRAVGAGRGRCSPARPSAGSRSGRLHVGDDAADHQPDHQSQAGQRLRRPPRRRQHLVAARPAGRARPGRARSAAACRCRTRSPTSSSVSPTRSALVAGWPLRARRWPRRSPITSGRSGCGTAPSTQRPADQARVRRHHHLDHADLLRAVDEVGAVERQLLEGQPSCAAPRRRRRATSRSISRTSPACSSVLGDGRRCRPRIAGGALDGAAG